MSVHAASHNASHHRERGIRKLDSSIIRNRSAILCGENMLRIFSPPAPSLQDGAETEFEPRVPKGLADL